MREAAIVSFTQLDCVRSAGARNGNRSVVPV